MEELLEREGELATLRALVEDARLGRGGTAIVEGAAGSGKTALLRALQADASGVKVLRAVGGELEREFPFGVVRQLFEREVHASDAARRERLLAGAAAHAAPVLGAAVAEPVADASFATLHGLYWLAAALADEAPLVLVVDDAHWCDAPSLRFLVFLARRASELPLLLCVGTRLNEPGAELELLGALADAPGATVVRPEPLSSASVRRLFADAAPDDAVATAIETTGGNPLLLRELVRSLAGSPVTAAAVRAAVPSSVTRSVQRRLNRLDPQAREVARALAVLGDASLLPDDPVPALRALRELELVEDDPPRFAHPLVRAAVAEPVIAAERDALHHGAARALRDRRGPEDDIVVHLLAAPPIGEPWAADLLREAARRAAAEGAPDAAVRRLRRALEELALSPEPAEDARMALVLELGLTAATAGDPAARGYLQQAARADDPAVAAQAIEAIRVAPGDDLEAAAATLRGALDRLPPGELHDRITGQLLNALMMDLRLAPRRAAALAELAENRGVLAHRTYDAAAGDAPASEVLALARRALEGRPFTQLRAIERPTLFWVVVALIATDGAAPADAALTDAEATARRHRSRLGGAFVSFLRAEWALAFGSAALAEAEARAAAEVFGVATGNTVALGAAGALVRALVLLGRVADADALVAELPGDDQLAHGWGATLVWNARADLRLAQNRAADALADLDRIDEVTAAFGWRHMVPGHDAGRRARTLLALGRPDDARADALANAEAARRRGIATFAAQALSAAGEGAAAVAAANGAPWALPGAAGATPAAGPVGTVSAAGAGTAAGAAGKLGVGGAAGTAGVGGAAGAAGAASPAPRARAEALFAYGLALRQAGRRTDARRPLTEARDLAARHDLVVLAGRASEELVIAGGKPRRAAESGAAALTPSERRMAEHAARGLSNREIAETLFVTRKTVEFTLGNAYAKLGIRSRTQLAGALALG
ncbi:regulatory LuxR family protein [Solirubrobacter pauli]|uniref:Regulatory LuxR family protein n=1 Tax=Solirubrobacter pauli TaxID=166793 RepID=A0A660L2H8_9ACTN|nr:LuxR family transcriptional regulator [Solirubrobacter pauli]RKQ88096.1 regulatory LuxR family protein [Solirubrobacter pauli]